MKIHILCRLYSYHHQNTVLYNTLVLGVPIFLGTSSTKRWRPGDFTIEAVVSYPVYRDQWWRSSRKLINARMRSAVRALVSRFKRKRTWRSWHHDLESIHHDLESLCSDNDPRRSMRKIKIISSDWIALLRRLLILFNNLRNSAIQSEEIIFVYACGNAGHYQSTMTPNRDVLTPNRDVMSAKCVSLKTWNKRAYCTAHASVYQFTRWSSCLDRSKFSHGDR